MNTTAHVNTPTNTTTRTTSFSEVWEKISTVLAFVPLVTTLAWLLYAIPGMPIPVVDFLLVPMMFIGWAATLLSCPLVLLKLGWKMIIKPLLAGLVIPLFPLNLALAGLFGGAGLAAVGALVIFAPAIVTIYSFFRSE